MYVLGISIRKIATLIARKLHYEGLSEMGLRFPLFNLQGVPFEKQKLNKWHYNCAFTKFLDAGIQDVSTSISIVHDLIERYQDDDDESDKHI